MQLTGLALSGQWLTDSLLLYSRADMAAGTAPGCFGATQTRSCAGRAMEDPTPFTCPPNPSTPLPSAEYINWVRFTASFADALPGVQGRDL